MNREIKFSGKRINNNEWVFGDLYHYDNCLDGWLIYPKGIDRKSVRVIPETVGQYTGVKDVNGIEIYEDDLIEDIETLLVFKVVWNKDFCGWWCSNENKTIEKSLNTVVKRCKIIGNIHENNKGE